MPNPGDPGFDDSKPKAYVLEMLPYPSGEPHVGHLKCYAVGDAIAHFRRRHGFQVIHPMGYDAFGLPAENNAIRTGEHPRVATERSIETFREQFLRLGHLDRLVARGRHLRARLLPLDAVDLPAAVRARPRLPHRGTRPVVPEGPDRARQRAGHRRPLRALRHPGRAAPARAVVLPHHRVRRPPARGLRAARVLARARGDDAAQLDRPLRGRRGRLPLRRARPRLPRLHHPPRHPLRRHLLRPRPRAPRARAPDRRHRAGGRGARLRRRRGPRARPRSAAPRTARRPASRSTAPSPTPSTASRSRCSSPTTC